MQTVPQRTVVFLDHVGPYWGIARKLQAVRNYMRTHELSGPLLIRYAADPTRAGGSSIAMKIGFALDGKHTPAPPFKMESWDAEFVATTRVHAGSAGLSEACRSIRAWAKTHNFAPTGAVIEKLTESSAGETSSGQATVQMAIRPVEAAQQSPKVQQRSQPGAARPTSPGQWGDQPQPARPQAAPPATGRSIERSAQGGRPVGKPSKGGPIAPHPAAQLRSAIPSTAMGSASKPAQPDVPNRLDNKTPTPAETDALATRLVPPPNRLDRSSRAWLGQVVLRLRAISRGTKRLYEEEGAAIIGLSNVIAQRYERLYGQQHADAKAADRAATPTNSNLIRQRKAVTRDLDRFMAVLASKSLAISETEAKFERIILQAAELVSALDHQEEAAP
ncbi:MAG: hypothetical protein ACE5E5_09565 [Phycisphaerae bacterium]